MSRVSGLPKSLDPRQVRHLIARAKNESRSFESLFAEMFPDDESTEDDCRPLDGLSIASFANDDPTTSTRPDTDYATQSSHRPPHALTPIQEVPRSVDSEPTEEDQAYIAELEDRADVCYRRHLASEVLDIWRDETHKSLQHVELADLRYDEKIARKCLGVMQEELYQAEDLERRRRLKMFLAWKSRRLAIWAIHSWIIRHRENVVNQRAEDGQDVRAATAALSRWQIKAADLRQRKMAFKSFFHACKYGRRWLDIMYERRVLRAMAILEQRYRDYRRERDGKLLRSFISGWRGKAAAVAAMEVTAVQHLEQTRARQASKLAHRALTDMYVATAESKTREVSADEKYDTTVKLRVLADDGNWRSRTRKIGEQEQVAEEFCGLKDQARAQRAFRKMRKTAAWGKQMENEAETYQDRASNDYARSALRVWRTKTAARVGHVVVQEAPATPAARLSALRQYQQGQQRV